MGARDRPVVAVLGDGSAMYSIQALWTAARYGVGVLLVVMTNGSYAVMDRLAHDAGRTAAWPSFEDVQIAPLSRALGCPARRIERLDELTATFDEVLPGLAERDEPLLLDVAVAA